MYAKNICLLLLAGLIGPLVTACQPKQQQATASSDTTVVYLVRHAEKDLADTTDNPALTPAGQARAQQLAKTLQDVPVDLIYSTRYQRNLHTVQPLADRHHLEVSLYEWHDYDNMLQAIQEKHTGKTVVVCGHGDNLLPIIRRLGAEPPVDSLAGQEYDKLFKVLLHNNQASVTMSTF